MNTIPALLAVLGVGLLVMVWLASRRLRGLLKSGRLPQCWKRRRRVAFVIGVLLVLTIPWQAYPLGKGTALGFPFFAAWFDEQGRDFVGPITLPAMLANAVVWFLVPQAVLACFACRRSGSEGGFELSAAHASAPPNGGPAAPVGNSGVSEGPPSES
jgi:hypothetical protein